MEKIIINYNENKQIKTLLKRAMRENDFTYTDVAKKLNTKEQYLRAILNKKHINCDDIKKILDVVGYDLVLEFRPKDRIELINTAKVITNNTDTNSADNNIDITDDDILALLDNTTKHGYSGIDVVDSWLENNGYIINSKLFDSNGKILDSARSLLTNGVSFGKTEKLIKKKVFIKDNTDR